MAGDDGRAKFMDDLAGMAGGAFSVLQGIRTEAEQMARSQTEAMIRKLDLVKREELDAAMEVARRAREQAESLETRLAALEARLAALKPGAASSSES
ncbi:accessory factor UbiK family protein [Roseomonas terrae]|jgi:BMFP domain-containing protein YqiC|uniref:Accessory factor UbiK family protein n=1 Tax=Neoroseomonas terrae TaxID=424799 RepID=A0ABS5EMD4_9PROT|nr:accessory factor UbiK family protein [Neoroseomonas terrae]MBR0652189.1 accessory factor UbiK family protein [Neoroseomonas terrae]